MIKYGIMIAKIGKAWHLGHQSIIDKIEEDVLEPVILLGSSQYANTPNCPLSVEQRTEMIELVNPDLFIVPIEDKHCWTEWHAELVRTIETLISPHLYEVTIYTHNKPEDLHEEFTFQGKTYHNDYYSKIFEIEGMHTTNLPLSGIDIRGTQIHEDLEGNKEFLDPKVYKYLKELHER